MSGGFYGLKDFFLTRRDDREKSLINQAHPWLKAAGFLISGDNLASRRRKQENVSAHVLNLLNTRAVDYAFQYSKMNQTCGSVGEAKEYNHFHPLARQLTVSMN